MGGFITAAARQARSNIRPLLLPPASNPKASPSLLKRLYDLAGIILSAMVLNHTASLFILLSVKDSILTWQRLGWYGHIAIMGSLVAKFFKGLQKAKGSQGMVSIVSGALR
jgi:lysophospholipid acyltransferase